MAKKENETKTDERTMPVHPDPNKETVLLRYPKDGGVKVLSAIKVNEQGTVSLVTVDATIKNQPAFYHKTDSRELAGLLTKLRGQMQDVKEMPEIYVLPFDHVPNVASDLHKLHNDPKDEIGLSTARKYRTSVQSLEKIMYDRARMPVTELQAMGFDIQQMINDGAFRDMELGKETSKLYPLKMKTGENTTLEGMYAVRPTKDEEGNIRFDVRSPLAIPEFLTDEKLRMEITKTEQDELRAGKSLGRMIMHEGEYCHAAFNRQTNRMIYVPKDDVKVPSYIYNARLNPAQIEELRKGGKIMVENCHYFGSDNIFKGVAQFDVHRMEFNIATPYYSKPYIPEFIDKQLTKDMREALLERRETIDGRQLVGKDGRNYTNNLRINPETLGLEFVRYQRPEQEQAQTARVAQDEAAYMAAGQEAEEYHVPDIQNTNRSQMGQSM